MPSSLDFSNEPKERPKTFRVHQSEPFNAEPADLSELINHNITPAHLVYGRNHGPIPDIEEDEYVLVVDGLVDKKLLLSLSDLKEFPETHIIAALQVTREKRS